MNNFYTYAYVREDGTPYYIGKGKKDRIHSPNRRLKLPPKERRMFLKKNLTEKHAFKHEIYMIAVFGRKDLGTGILLNMSDGGEGNSGIIVSDEVKKKMSDSHRGKSFSLEHRKKISESQIGKKQSEETKRKISESKKGNKLSSEQIKKLQEVNMGNKYRLGKKTSDETKLKLRESVAGHWKITFDDGRVLEGKLSIREICKKYGYDRKSIYLIAKGKRKKHKDIVSVEKLEHSPLLNT